jgi:uncharacterized protein YjbI with pentapeptide repeats
LLARTSAVLYHEKDRGGLKYDLANTRVADMNMVGMAADGAFLYQTDLHLSDLRGSHLRCVNLTNANLQQVRLADAQIDHVYVDGAHFEGSVSGSGKHAAVVQGMYWDKHPPTGLSPKPQRAGGMDEWEDACSGAL